MTGRTIVSGNGLQENLAKSVTCRFCHSDVTLLENVSARSGLGSSCIVSCKNGKLENMEWRNTEPEPEPEFSE